MKTTVEFNVNKVKTKILKNASYAQKKLDSTVVNDSNFFCPKDTGKLQDSAIIHTVIGSGLVQWETTYARSQYYDIVHKRHDRNPNACMKWFEAAKARWFKKWENIANAEYSKRN